MSVKTVSPSGVRFSLGIFPGGNQDTQLCVVLPKKMGHANGVSILTGKTKLHFSRIGYPNSTKFTMEFASM